VVKWLKCRIKINVTVHYYKENNQQILEHCLGSQLFKDFCFLLEVLEPSPHKKWETTVHVGYKSNQTMHQTVRVSHVVIYGHHAGDHNSSSRSSSCLTAVELYCISLSGMICSSFVQSKINFYFCHFQKWLQVLRTSKKWTFQNSVVIAWMAVTL
jgi:hypothetical protein